MDIRHNLGGSFAELLLGRGVAWGSFGDTSGRTSRGGSGHALRGEIRNSK